MNGNGSIVNGWSLKVVKGNDPGRVYAIARGELVLGSAVGRAGIDLADQEGQGPRRMAARQASLTTDGSVSRLRDLESPGGTFVNRRRLLPGQAHELKPGDVIQVGGVQLECVTGAPMSEGATLSAAAPSSFTLRSGATCRSWDDFLTVSAQRWNDLREELTSGRLAGYCGAIGRPELSPSAVGGVTPDERLDAWLRGLPATISCRPEMEVHPGSLTLKSAGGGTVRRSLRVTNVGYGLLHFKVAVDPPGGAWITIASTTTSFATPDALDLPVEVVLPENATEIRSATLVLDGNGGTLRIPVRIERGTAAAPGPAPADDDAAGWSLGPWRERLARWPARRRFAVAAAAGGLGRLSLAGLGGLLGTGFGGEAALPGAALAFGVLGALLGARAAVRRGGVGDAPGGAFAGAVGGLIVAMVVVAACQAVEPLLGATLGRNPLAQALFWTLIWTGLAAWSLRVVPPRALEATK